MPLDDISPLRQLSSVEANANAFLFTPRTAYRMRRSTNTDTPLPVDEPAGENPPSGAVIDYYLPASVSGSVTLEILDAQDKLVREYASTDAPEATREQLSKQLIPLYWLRMPRTLPASAGMHRWVWDLRYASPTATRYEYPISAVLHDTPRIPQGPLALPGTYKIRLIANGKAITVPLEIKMDPRVDSMQADLEELLALESRLAGMVSNSSEASLEAHSIREQIQKLSEKQQPQQLEDSRHKLDQGLTALLSGGANSGEKEPGLDELTEEVASLYTQVGQADAAPTAAQQQAASHTGEELSGVLQSWSRWKASSIPELNRQLRAAREPELDFERKPQTMPEAGDVE